MGISAKHLVLAVAVVAAPMVGGCLLLVETSNLSDGEGDSGGAVATPATTDGGRDATPSVLLDADATDAKDANVETVPVIARDSFSRTLTDGLGIADLGGAWQLVGNTTSFAVADGAAKITLTNARAGTLADVSIDDADVQVTIATDKIPNGADLYTSVLGRSISGADYRCRWILSDTGSVRASLAQYRSQPSATETSLASTATLFNVVAGEPLRTRCQVTGLNPTRLRMKVWSASSAEPSGWILDVSDATASLQVKGTVGVYIYAGTLTNGPLILSVDDLLVRPASLVP